jgi:hypothetical protein
MSEADFDLKALRRAWASTPERARVVPLPEQTRDVVPRVARLEALAHLAPLAKTIRRRLPGRDREALLLLDRVVRLLEPEQPDVPSLEEADRLLCALEDLLEASLLMPGSARR